MKQGEETNANLLIIASRKRVWKGKTASVMHVRCTRNAREGEVSALRGAILSLSVLFFLYFYMYLDLLVKKINQTSPTTITTIKGDQLQQQVRNFGHFCMSGKNSPIKLSYH